MEERRFAHAPNRHDAPGYGDVNRVSVQLFVSQGSRLVKNIRYTMRRLEIVRIDYLPAIAELGKFLLANFNLLVIFLAAKCFGIRHESFVMVMTRQKSN